MKCQSARRQNLLSTRLPPSAERLRTLNIDSVPDEKMKVLPPSLLSPVKRFKKVVDNMLKDRKTVTENNLHALVQAFQNQPNTVYGTNATNLRTKGLRSKRREACFLYFR